MNLLNEEKKVVFLISVFILAITILLVSGNQFINTLCK